MNKASGSDGIPVELFQTLKDDAVKVLYSICQQIWKIQQWPQNWKRSVFIPIPKKGNAKECSNYRTIVVFSHTSAEKAMTSHSTTLAWRIPWTEEPGRLQSLGVAASDTTEQLHFHFSLSCIGEGIGNPFKRSCLENPRDGGAWWAAVYGTRLKRLSSSTSKKTEKKHCIGTGEMYIPSLHWCMD